MGLEWKELSIVVTNMALEFDPTQCSLVYRNCCWQILKLYGPPKRPQTIIMFLCLSGMESKVHILSRGARESEVAGDHLLDFLSGSINTIETLQQSYNNVSGFGQSKLLADADSWTL